MRSQTQLDIWSALNIHDEAMHCSRVAFFWNTVNFVGFSVIHVSQGSVATYGRCGEMST